MLKKPFTNGGRSAELRATPLGNIWKAAVYYSGGLHTISGEFQSSESAFKAAEEKAIRLIDTPAVTGQATEKKIYSRYNIVRRQETLWKGNPAQGGAAFREFLITSDDWNSTAAIFQVYAIEGISQGIEGGTLSIDHKNTKLLSDNDFNGLEAAEKKFKELVDDAMKQGFKELSVVDHADFEQKLRESKD
jgi:hypothetical protein